ncbi:MAG: recombinase RecT [Pseudonocardiaceae bacterium]
MTTQTVKGALATRDVAMTQINTYRNDFATMLPSHLTAAAWVRGAQGLLRKDAKLRAVANKNPGSFLAALLDCARWGLEPGLTYHLVPFGSEIVGIRDYKGIIELIYRAGAVSSVKAEIVYAKDHFDYDQESKGPPIHKPAESRDGRSAWFSSRDERGEMVGAYSYAIMIDGSVSQVVIMADWEIAEHKAASKTAHLADSMWQKWPRSAWKKTVARELEKWVPSSPEWITHKVRAERAGEEQPRQLSAAALALPPPLLDDEVLDGEVVPPAEPAPAPARDPGKAAPTTPDPAPARPPEADPGTQKPNQAQMRKLFKLLGEGGVTSDEGRHRLASHVLDHDLTTFKDLSADDVSQLITRLEKLKAEGRLGAQPTDPEQPDQPESAEEGQ